MSEERVASNLQPTQTKMCPVCGETINAAAKKCIHCEEFIEKNWLGFKGKTLWDVLALLIVPMVLAGGGFLLNSIATERQKAIEDAETERQKAREEDRGRENALQSYFDKMTELLLEEELDKSNTKPEVQSIARIKTLTLIRDLDSQRKGLLLQFLHESKLISRGKPPPELPSEGRLVCLDLLKGIRKHEKPVVSLKDADLRGVFLTNAILDEAALGDADLRTADLRTADLHNASLVGADLRRADLGAANLEAANLDGAFLVSAILVGAGLKEAFLRCAFLRGAKLRAADLRSASLVKSDLRGADLRGASLVNADLRGADLRDADLRGASLAKALARNDQLMTAILCETTMPDGKKENRDCPSDSSSSTLPSLQVVPIRNPTMVIGAYIVTGINPGERSTYSGTCLIWQEEGFSRSVEILWTIGSDAETQQRFQGTGEVTEKGDLYMMYKGNFHGDGTWSLMSDGSIHGTWKAAGDVMEGTEIWTPVEAR